jgi:uncharacterized protein YraI
MTAVVAFFAALALPGMAAAQSVAYAANDGYTNLRAGPGTQYQVIARVYPGSRVDVLGCLDTRAWCDVIVQDIRGWIYANRLEFVYGGRRVLVPDYYSYFGAPYVFFRFGDHDRRRNRDYNKRRFGHPGGGGPGPGYVRPPRVNQGGDDPGFGHPGGGGPGPDYIPPPLEGTVGVPPSDQPVFGHPGGGGPGPEQVAPMEGEGGACPPGNPGCLESTQ